MDSVLGGETVSDEPLTEVARVGREPADLDLERAILFYVVDHGEVSQAELQEALAAEPIDIDDALRRLNDDGVLDFHRSGQRGGGR
jgi:transcription initiation factor IIE alpha subunit